MVNSTTLVIVTSSRLDKYSLTAQVNRKFVFKNRWSNGILECGSN